jgi:outer membrane biosynthesis protein TonB
MLKVAAALGAGTLAILVLWGFLLIAAPSVPVPPAGKIGSALAMRDPKLRDVTEQPHTTTIPAPQSVATVKPAAQPEPVPIPAPVATQPPPTPIPAGPVESPQEPDATQVASDTVDEPNGAAQPTPVERQSHAAHCTRYRTYSAATQSYRGFDGVVHPCRP